MKSKNSNSTAMATEICKIIELVEGDFFKVGNQRKYRIFKSMVKVPDSPTIPESHKGKVIVILSDCSQRIHHPNVSVLRVKRPVASVN